MSFRPPCPLEGTGLGSHHHHHHPDRLVISEASSLLKRFPNPHTPPLFELLSLPGLRIRDQANPKAGRRILLNSITVTIAHYHPTTSQHSRRHDTMSQSQPQPPLTPSYLRSLPSIRQRSSLVYSLARQDKLQHFTLHEDKLDTVVDYCIGVMKRDYGEDYEKIPGHSRWRHFVTPQRGDLLGGVIEGWEGEKVGKREVARRLVDLFVVSVLLDGESSERFLSLFLFFQGGSGIGW